MKNLLLFLAFTFLSINSYAKNFEIYLEGDAGQVMHGSELRGNYVYTSFDSYLEIELAKRKIEIYPYMYKGYEGIYVTYQNKFDWDTFHSFLPKTDISLTLEIPNADGEYKVINSSFKCGFNIGAGGNATVKKSCAKKLAKRIKSILKEN
jgi:hypothetical protein